MEQKLNMAGSRQRARIIEKREILPLIADIEKEVVGIAYNNDPNYRKFQNDWKKLHTAATCLKCEQYHCPYSDRIIKCELRPNENIIPFTLVNALPHPTIMTAHEHLRTIDLNTTHNRETLTSISKYMPQVMDQQHTNFGALKQQYQNLQEQYNQLAAQQAETVRALQEMTNTLDSLHRWMANLDMKIDPKITITIPEPSQSYQPASGSAYSPTNPGYQPQPTAPQMDERPPTLQSRSPTPLQDEEPMDHGDYSMPNLSVESTLNTPLVHRSPATTKSPTSSPPSTPLP